MLKLGSIMSQMSKWLACCLLEPLVTSKAQRAFVFSWALETVTCQDGTFGASRTFDFCAGEVHSLVLDPWAGLVIPGLAW